MKYVLIGFFLLFSLITFSQISEGKITGVVYDANGSIAGATVTVPNTSWGVVTDTKGYFELSLPEGKHTIIIRFVGYESVLKEVLVVGNVAISMGNVLMINADNQLEAVVVTGQFAPQSVRNSVYQIRTITSEQIRLRGATNIQTVLNTELGMRFSNDLTLGTTDVQLMGMSGQNVKILLDGVPMIDRGSTRESLGQIDINIIERIEIVEGPMSVTYGSDALAGVINIITKKGDDKSNLTLTARVQEETIGREYQPFVEKGTHNEFLGLAWQKKGWQVSGNFSRNFFGGWQGSNTGRKKEWLLKEQFLATSGLAYRTPKLNVWYRFNGTIETLKSLGDTYISTQTQNLSATDQFYITHRWFHQAQGEYQLSEKSSLTAAVSFTDYSRQTETTDYDLVRERRTLNLNSSQDKSIFKTTFARLTAQHRFSSHISLQHGFEMNLNSSAGERIQGTPHIKELAYFASSELKLGKKINIRLGLRFLKNSVYDAPPVIPSINTKFILVNGLDLRLAYARGFRSPALRELYFTFFDASHSIRGNTNLKAEYSDSFNAFLSYQVLEKSRLRLSSTLGIFYNHFNNLISIGTDPTDATISTYLNIDTYKTTGFTLNNAFLWKNLQASLGVSHIGRYNSISESISSPSFVWSNEINTNLCYTFPKVAMSLSLYYKFTGKLPTYQAISTANGVVAHLAETASFQMADITLNKVFFKNYTLIGGIKNLFNVTRLSNSAMSSGNGHNIGDTVPMAYGRSFFVGLTAQLTK
ncbi:MAG: TonB-dependent receptor [Spirosomataceae bacterium]